MEEVKPTREVIVDRINKVDEISDKALSGAETFLKAIESALNISPPYVDSDQSTWSPTDTSLPVEKPTTNRILLEAELTKLESKTPQEPKDWGEIKATPISINPFSEVPPQYIPPPDPGSMNLNPPSPPIPSGITPPTFPTDPGSINLNSPSPPTLEGVTLPNPPELTSVPPPILGAFPTIPPMPSIVLPLQPSSVEPNDSFVHLPTDKFNYSDVGYQTTYLDTLRAKVQSDILTGGTGISGIEDDIWKREYERDLIAHSDAVEDIIDMWSSKGFTLPNGVVISQVDEEVEKFKNKRLDRSREIAEKSADLSQANVHHALTVGTQLEQMWVVHSDNVCERALKAAVSTIELGITLFNAQVAYYNSKLETWKTKISVYEALIRAEGLKLEMYKNQLEGMKINVELRKEFIELYRAQLDMVQTLVKMYEVQVQAAGLTVQIEKDKVDLFRGQIEAYVAQIGGKVAEYGIYKSKIDGEIAKTNLELQVARNKVDMFKGEIDGYSASINGKVAEYGIFKSKVDAEIAKIQIYKSQIEAYSAFISGEKIRADIDIARMSANVESRKLEVTVYTAQLDYYKAQYTTLVEKIKLLESIFQGDVTMYGKEIDKGIANVNLQIEDSKILNQVNNNNLQMALQAAIQNLNAFVQVASVELEAAKGGAQVYSALVSAALQAINASASMSVGYQQSDEHYWDETTD